MRITCVTRPSRLQALLAFIAPRSREPRQLPSSCARPRLHAGKPPAPHVSSPMRLTGVIPVHLCQALTNVCGATAFHPEVATGWQSVTLQVARQCV